MKDLKHISKFLSLVLRHKPDEIDLELDNQGWADVDELILQLSKNGLAIDFDTLETVVSTNDKQRFSFNEDYSRIRANQGHSLNVDLQLEAQDAPEFLYHGTVEKFIENIKLNGLQKMQRTHVHLSKDTETATKVAMRRGKPIILKVLSKKMQNNGYSFYQSKNGVWLSDEIPAEYIEF